MTIAEFTIELKRTNELLERQSLASERIADALERLSPILPPSTGAPYQATVRDLLNVSPSRVDALMGERLEFAAREGLVPDSSSFRARVLEYEGQIRAEYGEEAVQSLPWNKK